MAEKALPAVRQAGSSEEQADRGAAGGERITRATQPTWPLPGLQNLKEGCVGMVVWMRGKELLFPVLPGTSMAREEPRLLRVCLLALLFTPLFILLTASCCQTESDQKPRLDSLRRTGRAQTPGGSLLG